MKNFIEIYDNVLTHDECENIISYFNNSSSIQPGTFGKSDTVDVNMKDSTDLVCTFHETNSIIDCLYNGLSYGTEKYVQSNQETESINSWHLYHKFNIQRYYPNQGYHVPHCESDGLDSNKRVLAWMYYLNTITDGGQTRFVTYDLNIDPIAGRLVIWPAYFTHIHHGIVSKSQTKYIATGWYVYS